MDAYRKHGIDLHVDYEHDMRIAAAWFRPEVRSDGLWAVGVKWTPRASDMLRDGEYRYTSPTFGHDADMRIERVVNVALTNLPATDNQQALMAASERVALADWDTAYIDNLPDGAFLYVEMGGKKDAQGKTVPRSLRHFPVKDSAGKLDPAHLRNALSRIPQSNVPEGVKTRAAADAKRLLGNQRTESQAIADKRLINRLAAYRTVLGLPTRQRRAS
jgi:hypothetical protein